jgi:transposase-like protein
MKAISEQRESRESVDVVPVVKLLCLEYSRRKTLQDIVRGRVDLETVIHSDGWRGYTGLVDLGYKKHFRVHHGKNEFVRGKSHINGIESFWGYAKTRLSKFRGIHKNLFYLHLKESEFRFNYRHENIYQIILEIFRNKPLN